MSAVVNVLQQGNMLLNAILNVLGKGIAVLPDAPVYTVASLPASAATGAVAFASNALKPGETTGAGTGMSVFWNPATSTWFTTLGVVVAS